MTTEPDKKQIHSIIVDTGPLIKNAIAISTIVAAAESIITTPAIISEIRDPATRSRVETTLLPFLTIKTPSPASLEAVIAFSKKTGDFSVLSRQDLGILALAYEVHCKRNGGPWGLRQAPKSPLLRNPNKEQSAKSDSKETNVAKSIEREPGGELPKYTSLPVDSTQPYVGSEGTLPVSSAFSYAKALQAKPSGDNTVTAKQNGQDMLTQTIQEALVAPSAKDVMHNLQELSLSHIEPTVQVIQDIQDDAVSDDSDGEWITPSNLHEYQAKDAATSTISKDAQMDVATMTTDFAMQNVLLQMNLNLLSTNMQRIRNIRTAVLRCHACFLVVKENDKQFCPRCGQPTLQRVTCSTNAKGEFRIHLAKNFQYNKRGDRFSVPKPVAGTSNGKWNGNGGGRGGWGRDLIFAEDQKQFARQIEENTRTKTRDLMDEDYLPSILSGDRGRSGGRPKVGAGKNVNSRKRF